MNSSIKLKKLNDSYVSLFQLLVLTFFSLLTFSCTPEKKLIIPQEPTIWVVSEIYVPNEEKFNGMVGYKIIPVNPGNINARPTWKLDHKGKYEVGQKVDFSPVLETKTASK
ncbi:hypothetical protein Aoki45_13670 [Algoriphagus sp. oki45]|uniref:hypothetical protein n=1 Tax=Algoriphagus sp. oki45 TaxID=3067294 RepID=UPI0027EC719F|nr:hypothetical protein Aoki45_13670 [Algoriphagus sp. oki45]